MTYRDLLYKAQRLINQDKITLGEYDEMTKPLDEEVRKVGKWIYDKASQNWRCSVCNETPKTLGYVGTSDFMEKEFAFCNHCGSEMVGAENDLLRN